MLFVRGGHSYLAPYQRNIMRFLSEIQRRERGNYNRFVLGARYYDNLGRAGRICLPNPLPPHYSDKISLKQAFQARLSPRVIYFLFFNIKSSFIIFSKTRKNGTGLLSFFANPAVLGNFRRLWGR